MALTAAEQLMLELTNRARLDPVAEAARHGITLNEGLRPDQLGTHTRFVLAQSEVLETSASRHSLHMLNVDIFSHDQAGDGTPLQRMRAAGFTGGHWGENISWVGTTVALDLNASIVNQHHNLMVSASHRINLLFDDFREIGIAQEQGLFRYQGRDYNTSMITQNFGRTGADVFITGVAYGDRNGDSFYSIGEAFAGVTFAVGALSTATAAAGGYALKIAPSAQAAVTGSFNGIAFSATVDASLGNVKLDLVSGTTFFSSADITLGAGVHRVRLLGNADLDAYGNGVGNLIEGNRGHNILSGGAGNDTVYAGDGNDVIFGGDHDDLLYSGNGNDFMRAGGGNDTVDGGGGNDSLHGMFGNDLMFGGDNDDVLLGNEGNDFFRAGSGNDTVDGGTGIDVLYGMVGNDQLTGGADADRFVFEKFGGRDVITDYTVADALWLDDAIWNGAVLSAAQVVMAYGQTTAGGVKLDFANGQSITVLGLGTLAELASEIVIF